MNETNGRRTLREAHAESCRAGGMTEEQVARDWAGFEADYDAWLDDRGRGLDALETRGEDAGNDEPENLEEEEDDFSWPWDRLWQRGEERDLDEYEGE